MEKTTKINKKPAQLQNKKLANWSEECLLLQDGLDIKGKDFAQLYLSPELLVTSKGKFTSYEFLRVWISKNGLMPE